MMKKFRMGCLVMAAMVAATLMTGCQKDEVISNAVTGVFHISATDSVCFAPGNLTITAISGDDTTYGFFENQYDVDYTKQYGIVGTMYFRWASVVNSSDDPKTFTISGHSGSWRVLTYDEWNYVIGQNSGTTRAGTTVNGELGALYVKASVNGVNGIILFPDNVASITWPTGATAPSNINSQTADFPSESLTAAQWTSLENQGCVFLPAAGFCNGSKFYHQGTYGCYWSATQFFNSEVYNLFFFPYNLHVYNYDRTYGLSVRLAKAYSN